MRMPERSSVPTRGGLASEEGFTPIGKLGLGLLLLAVGLAPIFGGYPLGAAYGQDTLLAVLRLLALAGVLCLSLAPPAPTAERANPVVAPSSLLERGAKAALWLAVALTVVSLLVQSRFFTSPVLLFAMLPATLDWLCCALGFTLACSLVRRAPTRTLPLFALTLALGASLSAVLAAREYGEFVQMGLRGQRAQAPFFSPNFLAGFLCLTFPLVAVWFVAVRERMGVLGLGVAAALMAGALVATGSRAGIALAALGSIIALLLALWTTRGRLPWGRVGALVVAALVLGFAFRGPLTERAAAGGGGGQEHSGAFRTWTWKGTLKMAAANPLLGTGPGTFPYRYAPYALVARTDLAHSSYLQVASEQGYPALVAVLATIGFTLLTALLALFRRPGTADEDTLLPRLLLCGLTGGLVAAVARSVFDSEWSLFGNAFPFWTAAGVALGCSAFLYSPEPSPDQKRWNTKVLLAVQAGVALIPAFLLLRSAQVRDTVTVQVKSRQRPEPVNVWPPDPQTLAYTGRYEEASQVEPTGKRYYQWGRMREREGDVDGAISAFQLSAQADPNALQTWRKLAETQEAAGDRNGAFDSWRNLVRLHEGPVGEIRAIPELAETHPAFAYAALARAATGQEEALALYEKAAAVVEQYSHTTPVYQQMELMTAQLTGADVATRRAELQTLYGQIMDSLIKLTPDVVKKEALLRRRQETEERFQKFISSEGQ